MSIFSRLADTINSNINAILDRAEDPEKMLIYRIRSMTRRYDYASYRHHAPREPDSHSESHDTFARVRTYVRGLSVEHWLLFLAGLVIGLILG